MATCASCGKNIKKGTWCFTCNDCYSVYCQDCGYTKKDEEDKYVCLNCGAEMQYGIANY